MPANQPRYGDVGTLFTAQVVDNANNPVDISTATTKQLKFKKPSGTVITKTASFVSTGTDGRLRYIWQAGDLNEVGWWGVQGYVVMPGQVLNSDWYNFRVYPNL